MFSISYIDQMNQYHRMIKNFFVPSLYSFFKIVSFRFGIAVFLTMFIRIVGNNFVLYPFVIFVGVSFGYTLGMLSNCYGIIGIVWMMLYLFPHGIIYTFVFFAFSRKSISPKSGMFDMKRGEYVVLFLALLLACGAESIVNPMVLKIFLKKIF